MNQKNGKNSLGLDSCFEDLDNPIELFKKWFAEAEKTEINDPNAMALASVDRFGMPNVRTVLLKDIQANSFVFYTNYESAKGTELLASGKATFVLHWNEIFTKCSNLSNCKEGTVCM